MACSVAYYTGGFDPNAPAQNMAKRASNGTVAGDPPAGYTAWDRSGAVTEQRALTAAETAGLAAADTAATETANRSTVQQLAAAAAAANPQDVTQDQAAVTSAAAISGTTGTLTALQLSNAVRQLAQGIALLAQNDVNTKKELNALIRLALGLFDGTS